MRMTWHDPDLHGVFFLQPCSQIKDIFQFVYINISLCTERQKTKMDELVGEMVMLSA